MADGVGGTTAGTTWPGFGCEPSGAARWFPLLLLTVCPLWTPPVHGNEMTPFGAVIITNATRQKQIRVI